MLYIYQSINILIDRFMLQNRIKEDKIVKISFTDLIVSLKTSICRHFLVFLSFLLEKSLLGAIFSIGDFSWKAGCTLPQNSYKPYLDLHWSFPLNENHIGPAISEILSCRHTNVTTNILLSLYKNGLQKMDTHTDRHPVTFIWIITDTPLVVSKGTWGEGNLIPKQKLIFFILDLHFKKRFFYFFLKFCFCF